MDISLVVILFYEMCVFSQMRVCNDFFETSKGNTRTWANSMGSKQWNSSYENDLFILSVRKHFFLC